MFVHVFAWVACADELDESNYVPWFGGEGSMIAGPKCLGVQDSLQIGPAECDPQTHQQFIDAIGHWQLPRRVYSGYDGSRYYSAPLQWTQSNFIQPQVMVEDRFLYDPISRSYIVSRYLDDVEKRYGGVDSILLRPFYTNLVIDDRNQLDMFEAMPGGKTGVARLIADFHRRGVRVLFPMTMWDQGTRAAFMKNLDADGINGDTQDGVPLAFSVAAERVGHPLAFQPENPLSDEALAWNVLSWWEEQDLTKYAQFVPKIYRSG